MVDAAETGTTSSQRANVREHASVHFSIQRYLLFTEPSLFRQIHNERFKKKMIVRSSLNNL